MTTKRIFEHEYPAMSVPVVATINNHEQLPSNYLSVNKCRYIQFESHRLKLDAARNQHVHSRQRLPVSISIGRHAPQFCVSSNIEHQSRVLKIDGHNN